MLANCGPLPFTMPLPLAEYGVLRTENGIPLCQKRFPTIASLSARRQRAAFELERELIDVLRVEIVADVVVTGTVIAR